MMVLALLLVAGRAAADPEVLRLAATEGPFDSALADTCRRLGDNPCKLIAAGRAAPFDRIELHEVGGQAYVSVSHAGRWFVGPSVGVIGMSDPTTSQRVAIAFVRFSTVTMPDLGSVAVIRIGLRITVATHCSHHSAGCTPAAPDYKPRVDGAYQDDAFVVCSVVDGAPRCTPPAVVPAELVRRTPFTGASLVLGPACRGFDWKAHRRSYDHPATAPCRYDIAPP